MQMKSKHYYVLMDGTRIEVPCPVAWEHADYLTKRIKEIDMKNKKYKVEIPEGYEVDYKQNDTDTYCKKRVIIYLKPIKKELPKIWEEYLRTSNKCYPSINHIRAPLEYNEAFKALGSLIELRDHYNSTELETMLYSIYKLENVVASTNNMNRGPIVLNSTKLGIEFGKNFRELIETAKPLL